MDLKKDLKDGIERFVRAAHRELSDEGYHAFWFDLKVKERTICLYLYHDMDVEGCENIISWNIYLQKKLNKTIEKIKLEKFDWIILIIEPHDLWSDNDAEKIKTETD